MARTVDIGSKRLISLAPTTWVRWLTGDNSLEVVDFLSGDFQWVAWANDVLIKVRSPAWGEFLVANDMQLRPHQHMARRLRAYAALGEERYNLPVYPVVVNILPGSYADINGYRSEFMGLVAQQDFRTINLWDIDVELVFAENLVTLLPFVPILKGGNHESVVSKAVTLLRAEQNIAELEPLLAFFATFVMETEVVRRIMRWDMTVLRESPWYNEILKEGLEQGIEQGIERGKEQMVLNILRHRFGELDDAWVARIQAIPSDQLEQVILMAFDVESLAELAEHVQQIPKASGQ